MTLTAPPLTLKDYLALPEGGPRYELIHGDLYMLPSPSKIHQRSIRRIVYFIEAYLDENDVGEVFFSPFDVILEEFSAVQPDILFVADGNPDAADDAVHGAPDLVVEVLSPSNAQYDLVTKRRLYQNHKVKEIWIVDPKQRTVLIDRRGPDGYAPELLLQEGDALTTPQLPGLEIRVGSIFVRR